MLKLKKKKRKKKKTEPSPRQQLTCQRKSEVQNTVALSLKAFHLYRSKSNYTSCCIIKAKTAKTIDPINKFEMSRAPVDHSTSLSRTFKYLLATQFLSRGIPFVFNSWIVRHLTEADYAVTISFILSLFPFFLIFFFLVRGGDFFNFLISQIYAVQFHLFVTCVLFLSREGFRRACMRADIKWFLLSLIHSSFYFCVLI